MRVTRDNLGEFLCWVRDTPYLALDTETTGLRPFQGDRPFSVVMADDEVEWYLDLRDDVSTEAVSSLRLILLESKKTFYMQNAKFDIHHMSTLGIDMCHHTIVDTNVMARLVCSWLPSYSLSSLAKHFLGDEKSDEVKEWCDSNPEGKSQVVLENGRTETRYHYDKAPHEMVERYACIDARLTYDLAVTLQGQLSKRALEFPELPIVDSIETALTPVVARMERSGVLVDMEFVELARLQELEAIRVAEAEYERLTGVDHVKSVKAYANVFGEGLAGRTEEGRLTFNKEVLAKIDDPAAAAAREIARAKASLNFFFAFKRFSDSESRIHTDFRQAGTRAGRFSSADPNLQNLKRNEDGEEHHGPNVREAIIPDHEHCLVMIDYRQQEYRLMLDYAGEMHIIQQIMSGLDVHQSIADKVGIPRQKAKTLNFGLIYGAGQRKIGEMLDMPLTDARSLIRQYFYAMPEVKKFMATVKQRIESRGYVRTWAGRRIDYQYPSQESYAGVNHLIQGGCADITKRAMVLCDEHLRTRSAKSRLSLTIHDELVFNIHRSEVELVPELADIMIRSYPHLHLPMAVDVSHSWASLGAKVKGYPTLSK